MGRELYITWPVFRREVDRCAELLAPRLGHDLRAAIFPVRESSKALIDTAIVQPALFTVEYALARLLMTLGLGPVATIGHSIGEYVSACLAGVFSEDALALVAERGRLMQLMPAGAMAAIGLAESALRPRLVPGVAIAAVNGPEICLVSGPTSAVQSLERTLVADRYGTSTSRVARVPLADDAADRRAVSACGRRGVASAADPPVPVVPDGNLDQTGRGNLTRLLGSPRARSRPFADAVAVLLGDESFIPIEVGPGNSLAQLAAQQPLARGRPIIATMPHAREARAVSPFSSALSARRGCPAWRSTFLRWLSNRFPVVLPPYPFQRQRFWIEPGCPSPACRTRALNYAGEAMLRPGSICQPGVASSRCRQVCAPRIAGWFWQSN